MHDMAQQVAGKEISIAHSTTSTLDKRTRHINDDFPHCRTQGFMVGTRIRTYLTKVRYEVDVSQLTVSTLLANWRSLRTLDLSNVGLSILPDTIGQLWHLRYLDLSGNEELRMLPKSLTKLINLQFLDLHDCTKLKELPEELSNLVNLRTLYVPYHLEYMPLGMVRMTRLTRLNCFIVGGKKSCLKLEELRALKKLKGSLRIWVCGNYQHATEYCGEGEYICNTIGEHLNSIFIGWEHREERAGNDEGLLEYLQPHTNLRDLTIKNYPGVRMAGWAREDSLTTSLPNLVRIQLTTSLRNACQMLEELPWLGRLQHLKFLRLNRLYNVEYMENRRSGVGRSSNDGAVVASNSSTTLQSSTIIFFPSLETLELRYMPKLKGWWMGELRSVWEGGLEYLTALETLSLKSLPELRFDETYMPWRSLSKCLRHVYLNSLDEVVSLPKGMRYLTSLQSLHLEFLPLKEIPEWIECLSSLQSLVIKYCRHLESLPRSLLNLTSLKEIRLSYCSSELKRRCEKPDGEYWPILKHIPELTF